MKKYLIIAILLCTSIIKAQFSSDLVLQLHSGTQAEMNTMTSVNDKAKLFYNTTDNNVYYHNGTSWVLVGKDDSKDSWADNPANSQIEITTKSDGITARDLNTEFVVKDDGKVGIGTAVPTAKLHVNGSVKIVDGTQGAGKVLTSDANGQASWKYARGNGSRGTKTFVAGHFTTANNSVDIFHLKTPFNFITSDMYHIRVEGYAYGAPSASDRTIDITFVGYCYQPTGGSHIINPQTSIENSGGGITAGQYVGSDGYIYLWFKTSNVYFNSFSVTSMYVGNGRVINEGEITIIQSSVPTL